MINDQYHNSDMKYKVALETALSFTADRLGVDLEDDDEQARLWEAIGQADPPSPECVEFFRLVAAGMLMEDSIDSCLASL